MSALDRASRTGLQVTVGYLAAGRGTVDWRIIAMAASFAVVVSVLQSLVDFPALPGGWVGDVTGRALRTFAQTAVGSIAASVLLTDVRWTTVLAASALAALTSVVTSAVATPFGPPTVKGTPALIAWPTEGYVGYTGEARHLRAATHTTTSATAAIVGAVAFVLVTAVGVVAAHTTRTRIVTAPAPLPPTPTPLVAAPSPLPAPDKSPAYFTALNRNNIPTATDHTALLLIANSVCGARATSSDAQQTDHIVATFPGKWTHAQAALIVDVAVDQYC